MIMVTAVTIFGGSFCSSTFLILPNPIYYYKKPSSFSTTVFCHIICNDVFSFFYTSQVHLYSPRMTTAIAITNLAGGNGSVSSLSFLRRDAPQTTWQTAAEFYLFKDFLESSCTLVDTCFLTAKWLCSSCLCAAWQPLLNLSATV